jgi:putative sterol carrier protein
MTDPTVEFFGELAERGHDPLLEHVKGTMRFELADGKRVDRWFLTVDKGDLDVSRRNRSADCTFRVNKALFDGIAGGEVNATAAVLRGAVAVDGDWKLLVMFQRLLPGPPGKRGRRRNSSNGRRRT